MFSKAFPAAFSSELALDQADNLGDIFTTRANVGIIHHAEFREDEFKLRLERPFSVAQLTSNLVFGRLPDALVTQHQHMRLDDFTCRNTHIPADALRRSSSCLRAASTAWW